MAHRKPDQNWDHFRYFLAVAQTDTLSAPAEQFGTEHLTVERYTQTLEDEPASRLFHTSNSGYEPTDAGERLATGAETIDNAYAASTADVRVGSITHQGWRFRRSALQSLRHGDWLKAMTGAGRAIPGPKAEWPRQGREAPSESGIKRQICTTR
jgi:DNA-binding transcriptional LysR family regulator